MNLIYGDATSSTEGVDFSKSVHLRLHLYNDIIYGTGFFALGGMGILWWHTRSWLGGLGKQYKSSLNQI